MAKTAVVILRGKLLAGAETTIREHLFKLMGLASNAAADQLRDNLSEHATTGRHWKNLRRPSSAPGEFPQEQTGELLNAIVSRPVDAESSTRWNVGFVDLPKNYLKQLEFAPPGRGGRRPLGNTMTAEETHIRMNSAVEAGPEI